MTTERITSILMSAFRGVPGTLDVALPEGKSLVLLGPNAAGKSTFADAVEWHFSGDLEILKHEGRQGDIRHRGAAEDDPTFVRIETNGESGGETWVDPNLGDAPQVRASGETFLLRGSTLQRFINFTKGQKWNEFANLLGLDEADNLRKDLQKVSNALGRTSKASSDRLEQAAEFLALICSVEDDAQLWSGITAAGEVAGIELLASLDEVLDPGWAGGGAAARIGVGRERLSVLLSLVPSIDIDVPAWNTAVGLLASDVANEIALLTAAGRLFESAGHLEACPLCRQEIDFAALSLSVEDRLRNLRDEALVREEASETLTEIAESVATALEHRRALIETAKQAGVALTDLPEGDLVALSSILDSKSGLAAADVLSIGEKIQQWDLDAREALMLTGEPSSTGANPVATLVRLVERGRSWRKERMESAAYEQAAARASALHEACVRRQAELFDEILDAISQPFDEIYGLLHPGESLSGAAVERIGDKGLELSVEFHGTACCPPHGVLSESHLNSLAIAVFLAMAETFNDHVGFLLLDDVVSSFDIEHREDLARLLVERYEDWQLIVLTHDHRFFEWIRKKAPHWIARQLTSWSFDRGPRFMGYITTDLLERSRRLLADGNESESAKVAREALEEFLQEWGAGVGAPVPFKRGFRNDQREPQEMINGLQRKADKLDASSKAAFRSTLSALEADLQGVLNPEAHASQGWAAAGEIEAAIGRIDAAVAQVTCNLCVTRVWRTWNGATGTCRCGTLHIPPGADR